MENSMTLHFHTDHLNKRQYRNMTWNVLLHLHQVPSEFLEHWDIHFWSVEDTNPQFFEHLKTTSGQKINPLMASGVTGKYRIDLYLIDSNNSLIARSNSDRVQHELCHAVLFGTKHFVKAVHNTKKRFKIGYWYWNRFWWKKSQISIIDIRKYINLD